MDNTKKKQPMGSVEQKKKERQRKLATTTDEERKEFKSKENKRRSELRRNQLSSMSKADLDAYRKKDATRKKTFNPTTPEPTEMCKDVTPLSHYRSKQSYEEEFEFLADEPNIIAHKQHNNTTEKLKCPMI